MSSFGPVHKKRKASGGQLRCGRRSHAGRRRADDAVGCRGRIRGLRHLQVRKSGKTGGRHREGRHQLQRCSAAGGALEEDLGRPWWASTNRRSPCSWRSAANEPHWNSGRTGAFLEHEQVLSRLGSPYFELRQKRDLEESMDGLILPGGESTVMGKLLRELELMEPLRSRILAGLRCSAPVRVLSCWQNSLREARRHILPPWISALCGTLTADSWAALLRNRSSETLDESP